MTDETYNGWTNFESWACGLHLSNDQGLYNLCTEIVEEADAEWPDSPWMAAERIKDFVEEFLEPVFHAPEEAHELARSMASDVGSLHRVDWAEVAQSFREE